MTNLPLSLVLKVCSISAAQGSLVGSEFQLLKGANTTRQGELIAGRTLARRAMAEMGLPEEMVGQMPDGSPAWPPGLCGSIAHSHRHVAVAIAPASDVRGIGIDIEDGRDLGAAVTGIASAAEIEGAIVHPFAGDREGAARLIFSAKEALYKCQAPLTGNAGLDFLEVRLDLQPGPLFAAEATGALDRATAEIVRRTRIEFQEIQGVIIATAWLVHGTAFTYKGKAVEVTEAAQRLNVGYILQGSVRKAANRVRINVQLIDGATGDHLWSERYDRDFGDIFALQDEISKSVVIALKVNLLPEELKSIAGRATRNAEAYEHYLQGRSSLFGGFADKQSLHEAREMFFKAIEIDPGYARAYAGIAECDALLWMSGGTDIAYQEILRNSTTALTFMPNLAEAHASKGLALFLSGHAEEAMTAFERAIELDPELFEAHEWYGEVCRNTGQFAKAAALFERAGELRPTDYISLMLLKDCYGSLGFHEKSVDAARRAFIRMEAQLMRRPNDAMAICAGAATLVSLGENQRAEEWAERALAMSPEDYLVHYNAACTYAVTGKFGAALERLEHVLSRTPRVRSWLLGIVKHDVQLDSLRDRPEFQNFVTRLEIGVSAQSDKGQEATSP